MEDLQTGRPAAEIDGSGHTAAHEIVAVLLAMRDAHAGMIGKLNPYAGSRSHTTVDPTIRATAIARLNTRAGEVIGNAAQENLVHADFWLCRHAALDAALAT